LVSALNSLTEHPQLSKGSKEQVGPDEIGIAIRAALADGRPLVVASLIENDGATADTIPRVLIDADGVAIVGSLGSATLDQATAAMAVSIIADDRIEITTRTLDKSRVLIEVARPALEVVVCGGGHVGRAVAAAAQLLDYRVTVIDDREDFASRVRFSDARVNLVSGDFAVALREMRITPASHVVIVTRGHRHDEICLREVIERPARYIGMIGSRRRTTTIRERLKHDGVAPELLRRVHAPIGLDIGAQTPEEIAVAIMAEIVLVRRGGTGLKKSAEGPMAKAR
jgi:xanthine dehydrogenase accessory factor